MSWTRKILVLALICQASVSRHIKPGNCDAGLLDHISCLRSWGGGWEVISRVETSKPRSDQPGRDRTLPRSTQAHQCEGRSAQVGASRSIVALPRLSRVSDTSSKRQGAAEKRLVSVGVFSQYFDSDLLFSLDRLVPQMTASSRFSATPCNNIVINDPLAEEILRGRPGHDLLYENCER